MKFSLMQQVYIQSDVLNLDAPVGEPGFIVRVDRNIDQAQNYCVRVPSNKQFYWMPQCDLVSANEWLAKEADEVIKSSLVNHALDNKDELAFKAAMRFNNT